MGFSEAVQWWGEWQLRVLVLGSLFLQYFLFIAAPLRKRRIPPWFRFLIWLAYLGSDALAIYALATLFSFHRKQESMMPTTSKTMNCECSSSAGQQQEATDGSSAGLEVFWAPILLWHLGGQDGITAYNIEDNELWMRHIVTAVSQVTVAMYVFRKSWPSHPMMLVAAILLFVPGILKCFEKPWALKSASINSLVKAKVKVKTCSPDENGKINSLDEYVKAATNSVRGDEPSHHRVEDKPYDLFVDLQYPYSVRLENLDYTVHCKQDEAHRLVKSGLSRTFDRLYTKEQMVNGLFQPASGKRLVWQEARPKDMCSALVRAAAYTLTFAALRLFHPSEAYDATDVKITYILLSCTVSLELLAVVFDSRSFRRQEHPQSSGTDSTEVRRDRSWPEQVAQYNLVGYLARNRKHSWFRMLATSLRCKDYLDQLWCMESCDSSDDITKLVHSHVVDGWKHDINDTASYRAFNDNRGQLTLRKEERPEVEWSLRRPFDESVLLWHLATDFCFSKMGPSHDNQTSRRCRVMSNYMAYLLFVNPEMLMTGTRRSLFGAAYDELNKMLKEKPESVETERELTQKIIQQVSTPAIIQQVSTPAPAGFVKDAWQLAEALMGSGNDEEKKKKKMWRVIEGVWVQMLCFSAGRCRGYLHAKSLGMGGEYLSYVWLLLSYMGMETLAERLQRTEPPEDGDKGAAGLTPARATTGDDNA